MKKTFLLAAILFISVISTACINNFAIQELNNKAKTYMDNGNYEAAIERLKSSIDLDATVFETQYNLAVAYTMAEDYPNAIKTYNDAIELNPDFADSYYSLAVCEENLAKDIISKEIKVNDDGSIEKIDSLDEDEQDTELTDKACEQIVSLLESSVSDYEKFMEKSTDFDKDEIEQKISELKEMSEKYVK